MNFSFENKVALVTGAGSGMGLTTAQAFAAEGAAVVLADVNEAQARAAAKQLVDAGHKAIGVRCDVALATRPQHHNGGSFDRAQPDDRDAPLYEPRTRQRRKAARDFRDHHSSCVLFRLGKSKSAAQVAKNVFTERNIGADQLPAASPALLPLNKEAEEKRATSVEQQFGKVAPGIVQYTTDVLFRDLWLRPDFAPRDRSLVTVSALIASGQVAQIPYHLNRAMDNGLTQAQAGEVITHLAPVGRTRSRPCRL